MSRKETFSCAGCGKFIDRKKTGPCKCGSSVRSLWLRDNAIAIEGSRQFISTKNSRETNWRTVVLVALLTIVGSGTGFFLAAWPGFFVGLLISVFTNIVGLKMITQIREITHFDG